MIELTILIVLLIVLSFLAMAAVIILARHILNLVDHAITIFDHARQVVIRSVMDAIQAWSAGQSSAVDIDRKRADLDHTRQSGELALTAQQYKLDLSREYAQIKIKVHRQQMLGNEVQK